MRDVVLWVCRTPTRLIGVAVLLLGVVLGVGSLTFRTSPESAAQAQARAQGQAAGGGSGNGGSGAGVSAGNGQASVAVSAPAVQPFVQAAVTFAARWSSLRPGESAEQWHAALAPLVTADLARGLANTDPGSLPGGQPTGTASVRFVTGTSALVEVPLSSGLSVLVTVVSDAGVWRVADIQPDTGDAGAATDPPVPTASLASAPATSAPSPKPKPTATKRKP